MKVSAAQGRIAEVYARMEAFPKDELRAALKQAREGTVQKLRERNGAMEDLDKK